MATPRVVQGTYYNPETAKKKENSLGKDDFLKILMTQLQNQDPTQPLQDREFIAQMAQFTSVEQLTNMANEMKALRQSIGSASSLIGKSVSWEEKAQNSEETITKSGVVESILYKQGVQYVQVEGVEVPLDQISKVWVQQDQP